MSTPTFTPNDQPVSQPQTTRVGPRYAPQETRQFDHQVVSRAEILRSGHGNAPMLLSGPQGPGEPKGPGETHHAERPIGVGVDQSKLRAGAAASAVVVGLVALVGVLVTRWVFKVPVLAPAQDGTYGDVHTTATLDGKIATAVVNLAVGVAIGTLVSGVARRATPAGRPASGDFR